jgi:hypothetical protein
LTQLPQILQEVRTGVQTLNALASTPAAAVATGSPIAGAAVAALGAQLAYFLADAVKAIDDDIDGIKKIADNYRNAEDIAVGLAQAGIQAIMGTSQAQRPSVSTPPYATPPFNPNSRVPSHS